MKTFIASIITTIALTTTASAGICSWVEKVDIAGSVKSSAVLSGGLALVATGNPAIAVVNGAVTGAVVGGSLLAVDGTCYVFDEYDVAENTSEFVSDTYASASNLAFDTYGRLANYFYNENSEA